MIQLNPKLLNYWFNEPVVKLLGSGHIHNTYLVEDAAQRYVLQRVNEYVFQDSRLLTEQCHRLLEHWRSQNSYQVPQLVRSKNDHLHERVDGDLWRVWRFVESTRVVEPIENLAQAEAAGAAFGFFQQQMADFPAPPLKTTIDGFMRLPFYLADYDRALSNSGYEEAGGSEANKTSNNRVHYEVTDELRSLQYLTALIKQTRTTNTALYNEYDVPNCHIHGDCKVNNLLFDDKADAVVAIIDFDTAMFGHWGWDFGDLVRSICFSRGGYDGNYFSACLGGFARHRRDIEAMNCASAPGYVAFMLGLRFLTDHLRGDVYFKVGQRGENLLRAEQQFALFQAFESHRDDMLKSATTILRR